ncbi:hypothetical protein KEM54_000727 [Ascosphaera aggregata]|nr:hypothetical protein KEM54_000727 [Ascosphaera aggregata]
MDNGEITMSRTAVDAWHGSPPKNGFFVASTDGLQALRKHINEKDVVSYILRNRPIWDSIEVFQELA